MISVRTGVLACAAVLWIAALAGGQDAAASLPSRGENERTLKTYENILAQEPGNVKARIAAAEAAFALGQYAKAEKHFNMALDRDPSSAQAAAGLGRVYAVYGRLDQAIELLGRALTMDENNLSVRLDLADIYGRMGWSEKAAAELTLVLITDDKNVEARRRLADFYLREGKIREACRNLEVLASNDTAVLSDYIRLAELYERLGEFESTRTSAEKAASLSGHDPRTQAILGRLAYRDRRYDEAANLLQSSLEDRPLDVESLRMLALSYDALNKVQEAIAAYKMLLTVAREDPQARHRLARLYEQTGRIEDARRYYAASASGSDLPQAARDLEEFERRNLRERVKGFVTGSNFIHLIRAGLLILLSVLAVIAFRRRSRRLSEKIGQVVSSIRRETARADKRGKDTDQWQ